MSSGIIAARIIDKATAATHAIVAADSAKHYEIWGYQFIGSGTVNVYVDDGTDDLLGSVTNPIPLTSGAVVGILPGVMALDQTGAVNRPINLILDASVAVNGWIWYRAIG